MASIGELQGAVDSVTALIGETRGSLYQAAETNTTTVATVQGVFEMAGGSSASGEALLAMLAEVGEKLSDIHNLLNAAEGKAAEFRVMLGH